MSLRSYSSLIVLETVFDSIPNVDPDVTTFADLLFSPNVNVVEQDCGTLLGEIITLDYTSEGIVELATGLPLSKDRIEQLLAQGIYTVKTRSLSTCISTNGVCQACYHASRQSVGIPSVGATIRIYPEYVSEVDVFAVTAGTTTFIPSLTTDLYDYAQIYYEGTLYPSSSYTITDTLITLNSGLPANGNLVIRYVSVTRTPLLYWLADTYSGALLGIKSLPYPKLFLKKSLLTGLVMESVLELLVGKISGLTAVPNEISSHLVNIMDPLEKSLFVLAIYSVYLNVL